MRWPTASGSPIPAREAAVVTISKPNAADLDYNKTSLDLAAAYLAAHGVKAKPDQTIASTSA